MNATLQLPPELLEQIARRVLELLAERDTDMRAASPWMTTIEAAEYLRCPRSRVFDLTSQGRLRVHKDGARSLYLKQHLDDYLAGGAS